MPEMLHVRMIIPIPLHRLLISGHKFLKQLMVYFSATEVYYIVNLTFRGFCINLLDL